MKKLSESNARAYTLILILITFVVRLFIAAYTGLGIGESYYFRGAEHLELSYFDQPPLFFWLSGITIKIFGLTNLGLRFPAVVLFAGTSWLLFVVTKRLFNAKAGFWAVVMINLSAVFTVAIACWYQPDAPLMFFWMGSVYFIIRIITELDGPNVEAIRKSGKAYGLWLLTGVFLGLATLSKYHVLFVFAGVFMFLATNKKYRHWLSHPGPYLAVVVTFILAIPVLWWNYENNWASFVFQGARAGTGQKFALHPEWFFRSIGGQMLWLLPWIWIPIIRELYQSYKKRNETAYGFVFWLSILPIVFFTVVTLWSDLQYHFHWQAPGYMMLFIPLGAAIDRKLTGSDEKKSRSVRRWLRFSSYFTGIVIVVLTLHMVTGFWSHYGPKWVVNQFDPKSADPTVQGIDYEDIMTRFQKEGWLDNKNIFAASNRWWLAGKEDWALKGKKDILVFNVDPRNLAFLVDPKTLLGKDAILVAQDHNLNMGDLKPFFDDVQQVQDIPIIRSGVDELHLQVYYCKHFHQSHDPRPEWPLYRQLNGQPPFGK